jgi:hypothetical protein
MNKYAVAAVFGDGSGKATDSYLWYLWDAILSSDLMPSDKIAPRIAEGAVTLLVASGDTEARVMTVAIYFVHEKLKPRDSATAASGIVDQYTQIQGKRTVQ